jgi:hypothetical protein
LFLKSYHPIACRDSISPRWQVETIPLHRPHRPRVQHFFKTTTLGIPWRDLISRPIALVSSVAGGDDTTRPHRKGGRESRHLHKAIMSIHRPGVPKQEKPPMSRLPVMSLEVSWGLLWTSSDVAGSLTSIDIRCFSCFGSPDLYL